MCHGFAVLIAKNNGNASLTTISEIRSALYQKLQENVCDKSILDILYSDGRLLEQEDYLWDYKETIGLKGEKKGSKNYKAKLCETVKDIVAFYNSFGGYLIFGVRDTNGQPVGFSDNFPFDDIMDRLKVDLKKRIDITIKSIELNQVPLLIVHIPGRKENEPPKAFAQPAKASDDGKIAYRQDDIYYRDGKGSSPARGDALAALIANRHEVSGIPIKTTIAPLTENNLPERTLDRRDFVGRRDYLDRLWLWLLDRFLSVRLVTGIGGLGKTTLVRMFVEDVIEDSPAGFEKVIWFSAKSRQFDAEIAKFIETDKNDPNYFSNPERLYRMLLSELGNPQDEIALLDSEQELLDKLTESLVSFPSLVIVDDLDSLPTDQQAQVFHELGVVFGRTASPSSFMSRCIFTAREQIGAAPRQTIKLQGFEEKEFFEHLDILYERFGLQQKPKKNSNLFKKFLKVSGGSPMFATSIVRLVNTGFPLDQALLRFQSTEGDAVRRFAFEREIEKLDNVQLRCLYALINIAPCSLIELSQALEIPEEELVHQLKFLRDFHLVERDDSTSVGGREYGVESYIKLLVDLIETKLVDPKRIQRKCKEIRSKKRAVSDDVAKIIGQTVALWRAEKYDAALDYIVGQKKLRPAQAFTADLKCVLGRAYLRVEPCLWKEAEHALRDAYGDGCQRPELLELWLEAREEGKDWEGIVEVARIAIKATGKAKYYLVLGRAQIERANSLAKAGDAQAAIDIFINAGSEVNLSFKRKHTDPDYATEINSIKNQCFRSAMDLARAEYRADADKLYLWEVTWKAFLSYSRTRNVLEPGIRAAGEWATWKLRFSSGPVGGDRSKFDEIVGRLSEILELFYSKEWGDSNLVAETEDVLKKVMNAREKFFDV